MSEVRYWLALALVCLIPGVFAYWFSIHPLIDFWRKVGLRGTMIVHYGLMLLFAFAAVTQRRWILATDNGNNAWLAAAGAAVLILAAAFRREVGGQLRLTTLMGWPELDPSKRPQALLTEGVYAKVRHPRYVQILLALWGWSLIANYLAAYVLALGALPGVGLVVWLEERELRARYGAEYDEYCGACPGLCPGFDRI
jgi:protein-S-isoprenylcysteine O-methyltransferase Ste14